MSDENEQDQELIVLDLGLRDTPGPETPCPKCSAELPRITFHAFVIISMGEEEWPCAAWTREGMLTGPVTEHLCVRCQRCGYGYPAKTADSS
jgi:hypothetical protein